MMTFKALLRVSTVLTAGIFLLAATQGASASGSKNKHQSKPPVKGISTDDVKPSQPIVPLVRDHRSGNTKTIVTGSGQRVIDARQPLVRDYRTNQPSVRDYRTGASAGTYGGATYGGVTVTSNGPREGTKTKKVPCIGNMCWLF